FPSPTSDRVWIKADDGLDVQQAVLYTSTGQIVDRWNRPESSLALGRLPAGIYRLAIITDKGVVHKSVAKN
ncbi:MAG: T9SS type A sorting domain-containing protein, partial [Saprospiraceae bacterium]|nr:T9SS type A sorting domain-containing protein [Saprospiraceae bacterium]